MQCAYSNMRRLHESCVFSDFLFSYVFVVFYFQNGSRNVMRVVESEVLLCGETIRFFLQFKAWSGWQVQRLAGTTRRLLDSHVCGILVLIILTKIETDQG